MIKSILDYDNMITEYTNKLQTATEDEKELILEHMYDFQYKYMDKFLREYCDKATTYEQRKVAELLTYAVHNSTTGNAIVDTETEQEANAIQDTLYNDIGDMILDCQIYESNGQWAVDCMFGGAYVPEWDGWTDETMN